MRDKTLKKEIEALNLGTHIACIYKDKSEQFSIVIPFIFTGLKNNEKCIYIADENTIQEIVDAFEDSPIKKYMNSNQLELLTREDAYLKDGSFDPDTMIELLTHLEREALKHGYSGLRVTGEMTWIFTNLPGVDRLIEYEAKLNNFFPESKSIALCQYNEKKFQPEILLDVLHTHPVLIIYDSLCENPRYLPPEEFFAQIMKKTQWSTYEKARDTILNKKKTEETIKEYEQERGLILDSMYEIIAYYDKDKKIQWVNKAGGDLAGVPPETLMGNHCYTVWYNRDTPCEHCPVYSAWETGKYQEEEIVLPDKSTWRIRANPVYRHGEITGIVAVSQDITEQKRAEREKNRLLDELNERVKELSCLYGIDEIVRKEGATLDEILEDVVYLISASWQYPDIVGSCITYDERQYKTKNFAHTQWMQQADIVVHSKKVGAVTVCYTDEPPTQEVFIKGEENLIASIAKRLGEIIERRKAEISLKRAEKKFRDLFEHASDAIFIHDLKKTFLDVNETAATRLGYTKEELLQLAPADINPPEYAGLAPERIRELQQKGYLYFETVHITKDGKKIPTEVNSTVFEYEGKKAILSIARDITERIEAERALRESELRYRTLFESAPLAIELATVDGTVLTHNDTMCQILGYSREELSQINLLDLYVNPHQRTLLVQRIQNEGFVRDFEVQLKHKDGTPFWASLNVTLLPLEGEDVLLTMTRDITDRKRAEKALQQSEEKYRELVENLNDVIYTVDNTGVITYVSPAVDPFTGYASPEVVGHPFSDFIYEEDLPRLRESFQKILSGNTVSNEYRVVSKSGDIRWMRTSSRPVVTKGQVTGVQGVLTDITERKRVEDTLQYRLDFEELIATLSTHFINLSPDEIDRGIHMTLENVGTFTGVDRCYVFLFNESYTSMDNTHEWCAEGIEPQKDQLQGLDVNPSEWGVRQLRNLEPLAIPRVADLPPEASADKTMFQAGGIQSLICIPIVIGGTLIGFIGLDSVRTERMWSDDIVSMLKIVAEILANAFERKRSEEMLWEREEQYRTTIDTMGDAIHVMDDMLQIILVNNALRERSKQLGLPTVVVGKTLFEAFPFLPDSIRDEYDEVLTTGKPLITEERTKIAGYEFVTETRKIPILEDGKVCRVVTVIHDITERKKAEEQIKASLREKEVLLREIHHRVKNNLQVISSLLSLQAAHSKDSQYAEMLQDSQHRIRTMALIHERLYQSENLADIDFNEYVTRLVYGLVRSYNIADTVTMTIDVEDVSLGIDAAIPCGLIINELVSNSLKHAFPHRTGEIIVQVRSSNKTIELTVADNGIGMEDIDFRATETLGLDLVVTLAEEQLNGEITLQRTKGTAFTIRFETN
jgi:PAS domain S-box-containing protein